MSEAHVVSDGENFWPRKKKSRSTISTPLHDNWDEKYEEWLMSIYLIRLYESGGGGLGRGERDWGEEKKTRVRFLLRLAMFSVYQGKMERVN